MEMNDQERAVLERQLGVIEGAACGISSEDNVVFDVITDAVDVISKLIRGEHDQ